MRWRGPRPISMARPARDQHAVSRDAMQPGFAVRIPPARVVVGRIRARPAAWRLSARRILRARPHGRPPTFLVP